MSSRRLRLVVTFVTIVATFPFLVGAGNSESARAEHQRIVEFWTPERVAQAIPRDFVFDPGTGRFGPAVKPDNPGNGNGGGNGKPGGGDDGDVVTGSSWEGGGAVDGALGKILFAMDGTYYICSGTVIDDGTNSANGTALILTAAHCVYDEANREFASYWTFIPDYDAAPEPLDTEGLFCDSTAYGCWTGEAMVVHSGYADAGGFNDIAILYDFAVVRVGIGGHLDGELDETAGIVEQGYSFEGLPIDGSQSAHAFGYPAEKKWDGDDLIYCAGPVDGDPYNANQTYRLDECKLNGGSSGGGWFWEFDEATGNGTLVSVNSYGYRGVNAMHGPFFNGDTAAVYQAAKTGATRVIG